MQCIRSLSVKSGENIRFSPLNNGVYPGKDGSVYLLLLNCDYQDTCEDF